MSRNQGGVEPPKEVEGQTPHHEGLAQEWHADLGLVDNDHTPDLRPGVAS
jgi:hypothetical protein